jgi:arginyl-tRNA synthetase
MLTKMKIKIAPVLADEINKKLSSAGVQVSFSTDQIFESLELPKNSDHGDLAFPCFHISKIVKRSPQDVAKDFAAALALPNEFVEATVVGGYLNFKFSQKHWQREVLAYGRQEVKDIGASKTGQGKTVVIDYSSPNVAKPMSIGHLRSTVIGQALKNILRLGKSAKLNGN